MKLGETNEHQRESYWEKSTNWLDVFKIALKKKKKCLFFKAGPKCFDNHNNYMRPKQELQSI